jgi:hypothetical protein
MALTLPNLDNRRYADLVEEARGLMIVEAPTLTNHNPSDPAITLVEALAYFVDALLYRVDRVTDANRAKFVKLLRGPDWQPPSTPEELDAAIYDAVKMLRRTDRAVTVEDFEFLARAAAPYDAADPNAVWVARARCIPNRNLELEDPVLRGQERPGHVSVVIVPNADPSDTGPAPSLGLVRKVFEYLEPRRLLATSVHVVGPRYVAIGVRITLRLRPDAKEQEVRDLAVRALNGFLHPLHGGVGGDGWPFGRSVHVSEIYRLLDTLDGVDYVRRSLDSAGDPVDELEVYPAYEARLVRNQAAELVSVWLEPDELVAVEVDAGKILIETPLKT